MLLLSFVYSLRKFVYAPERRTVAIINRMQIAHMIIIIVSGRCVVGALSPVFFANPFSLWGRGSSSDVVQ